MKGSATMKATQRTVPFSPRGAITRGTVTALASTHVVVTTDHGPRSAAIAVSGFCARPGDAVVLALGEGDEAYVIGVLGASPVRVEAPAPSEVDVTVTERCDVLRVRDADGHLLFEHRDGKSVVHAPGDLVLSSNGAIELRARTAVRVHADEEVELEAGALKARSESVELEAADIRVEASSFASVLETATHAVDTLELHAHQLIERAVNVYRDAEELAQTRAGRIRLVAEGTFHLLGKRAHLKAEEDLKLKGEKIHLG
jgi:hypothetical protein